MDKGSYFVRIRKTDPWRPAYHDGRSWFVSGDEFPYRERELYVIHAVRLLPPDEEPKRVITPVLVPAKCPYCGAEPYHTERGICEDCGQGEGYVYE